MLVSLVMQEQWRTYVYCICPLLHRPIYDVSMNLFCWPQFRWHFSHFARFSLTTTLKSQCRKISRISNQFQKFQFWLIQPKHAFRGTISRNYILRILEKFQNSQKIHFLIQKMGANFNRFQRNSTSAPKLLLTWYYSCI